MEREEFKILVKGMKAVYTQPTFLPDKDAFNIWYSLMQDLSYEVCSAAIQKYMLTNKFPPTIADIRELAANVQNGDIPDWGEGWEEVQRAIRKHGMYNVKEAMDSFTPLTRQTVERLGFRNICVSENPMAERANFRQCYEILAKREQTRQQLALPLQDTIKHLQSGFMMIGDGGD